jgi:hypothetical protein
MNAAACVENSVHYELRFISLFNPGRGYVFPCDASGQVDLDTLSERARDSYFYVRSLIGREVSMPTVQRSDLH